MHHSASDDWISRAHRDFTQWDNTVVYSTIAFAQWGGPTLTIDIISFDVVSGLSALDFRQTQHTRLTGDHEPTLSSMVNAVTLNVGMTHISWYLGYWGLYIIYWLMTKLAGRHHPRLGTHCCLHRGHYLYKRRLLLFQNVLFRFLSASISRDTSRWYLSNDQNKPSYYSAKWILALLHDWGEGNADSPAK